MENIINTCMKVLYTVDGLLLVQGLRPIWRPVSEFNVKN